MPTERHWLQDLTTHTSPLVREGREHRYRIVCSLEMLLEPDTLTSDLPEQIRLAQSRVVILRIWVIVIDVQTIRYLFFSSRT